MTKVNTGWNLEETYTSLPEIFYSKINPNPVSSPELVIVNERLAGKLGLDGEKLKEKENIDILAGNNPPIGMSLLAMAYGGHQFGNFTMLGDGRAALVGEQITPEGNRVDIHLKGSGRTPYSRGGDGRAALGPMLREYIISEGMHGLNIPTTRSLAVVSTGKDVYRQEKLPGAILTRVAKSHIRVGTFEYAIRYGEFDDLKALADYTINRHFPKLKDKDKPYLGLLKEVITLQASLIAKWNLVGFIHGVMNTDNVAISGESIDYGPCAFMDTYDPNTVFSSIDIYKRYAYGNQSKVTVWNLSRFAETLLPLIDKDTEKAIELAKDELDKFDILYYKNWIRGMRSKLGILNEEAEDEQLIDELLDLMGKYKADYTNTFLNLSFDKLEDGELFQSEEFNLWKKKWTDRLNRQEKTIEESKELMKKTNPSVIPRNHLVEEALEAAETRGDYSFLHELVEVLKNPFDHENIGGKFIKTPKEPSIPYKTYCGT